MLVGKNVRLGVHLVSLMVAIAMWLSCGAMAAFAGGRLDSMSEDSMSEGWRGFRGDGNSRASSSTLPLTWSDDSVAWRYEVPGYGQSSPVVLAGKVFVTSIDGENKETNLVTCLELESGAIRWIRSFPASQQFKNTKSVSRAAPTPAVDEDHLFVFFESGDLYAFRHDGEKVWHRSLTQEYGKIQGNHGVGSSLVQSEEMLHLLIDHDGPSYLLGLDKATGANRWKVDRNPRVAWSTPLVRGTGDDARVIVSSNGSAECFAAGTGERRWYIEGLEGNTVPSPSSEGDLIVVASSRGASNLAIRTGGAGDVSESHVVWRCGDALSSFGSPLMHGGKVYFVNRAGVARVLDAATGDEIWKARVGGSCWASPIGAGDRVYFFTKDGLTTVVDANATEPVVLAENPLTVDAPLHGVAAVGDSFVIRAGATVMRVGPTIATSSPESTDPESNQDKAAENAPANRRDA